MRVRGARATRTSRGTAKGQALAIFALLALFLFAVTGLAVDAGLSYLSDNGAERAAASGALAGVPYMPNGWNGTTACSGGGSANAAACAATQSNGFTDGATRNGHTPGITVTMARYPSGCSSNCDSNKLTVTVTAWVSTTFMRVLGIGDHQVTATETAFYLSPISLGQPGAQLGSSYDQLGTSNNFYFLRSEGWGNPRGEGDAFTPDPVNQTFGGGGSPCSSSEPTAGQGTSTDIHLLNSNSGTEVPASSMSGWNALPARGGYSYSITVPSGTTGQLQVYNPAFVGDQGYSNGATYNMHEQDGSFNGTGSSGTFDQYSSMLYTVFKVTDIFDHTQDTPIAQYIFDGLYSDGQGPSSGTWKNTFYNDTIPNGSSAITQVYHAWLGLGDPTPATYNSGHQVIHAVKTFTSQGYTSGNLPAGTYRLRMDHLDHQHNDPANGGNPCTRAHKGTALRLMNTSTNAVCVVSGCNLAAINELGVYTPINGNGSGYDVPIFQLPKDYAGKQIFVYVFDPGDVSGSNSLSLINSDTGNVASGSDAGPPAEVATVNIYDLGVSLSTQASSSNLVNTLYPNAKPQQTANTATVNTVVNTSSDPSYQGSCTSSSCNVFNSHWVLFSLTVPANYTGSNGSYWKLRYTLNGTAGDTFTVVVNYGGSPVHLI